MERLDIPHLHEKDLAESAKLRHILVKNELKLVHDNGSVGRGTTVKDFDFIRQLGKGGYSTVYLVKHKRTGYIYALKCVDRIRKDRDKTLRIRQEVKVLHKMRHPNVIRLHEWFEDNKRIYLLLEYIEGKDLASFFKKEIPKEKDAINIIRQIIQSIQYCHDHNIIHRDIKLGNILIDRNHQVKLTDFGLCTYKQQSDELFYEDVGTVRFTSPELLFKTGYDESVDIWALGVTIYVILTGKYPFDGESKREIFHHIKHSEVAYDETVLNSLQIDLVSKLLRKNPEERLSLQQILDHPWLNSIISDQNSDKKKSSSKHKKRCHCQCHHKH